MISIHAPAKGATQTGLRIDETTYDFNPRSREGSDFKQHFEFLLYPYFNPRSREGSDFMEAVKNFVSMGKNLF